MDGRRRRLTLNANTTYTLLFTSPGGDHLQLVSTPLNREDTGGAAGWSIADESHFKATSNVWGPTITRLAFRLTIRGTTTSTDTAPRVETAIPDQTATVGTAFSYAFPENTFSDLDGDPLAYAATTADGAVLPAWLTFTDATRTHVRVGQGAQRNSLLYGVYADLQQAKAPGHGSSHSSAAVRPSPRRRWIVIVRVGSPSGGPR